ncbi:MAG: hypothetical protein IPJ89_00305 [Candidatus Iainarchaeum archaeon]|uniref:Uncharacterized protein n=1 Tax=Candidatus Iainarchaeum sp. TaxID=3101447 RepID=A0A7T9I1R0_9ARCH|nr:MAG: hypothetical protein IPJ89_00305 [Candidatus Diapherotrites archaeon]
MHPNAYSLVHAAAATDKPAIHVVFSTPLKKVTKQYAFFPSLYLPRTSTNLFETILQSSTFPKHQCITHAQSLQIIARDFLELKKIAFSIFAQTNYLPLLVEPERQFLLTQKWRYFQAFDEQFKPLPYSFTDAQLPGFVEPIYATLKSLHVHNPKMQAEWNERITCAHELLHPITEKLLTLNEKVEMSLDNQLFSKQMPLPIETATPIETIQWSVAQREEAKQRIITTPLDAEGKCSCCIPRSFMEAHVLPHSMVKATTTQDGLYIHTQHAPTSQQFHAAQPGKEKREARAKEYALNHYPLGPLVRNQTITLPLQEAIQEMRTGNVKIAFSPAEAKWKCRNETPFALQAAQQSMHQRAQLHAQQQNALLQPYMTQFQLYYTQFAAQDPRVQLHVQAEKLSQQVQENMPWHLIRGDTKWRSKSLTNSLLIG